MGNEHSYFQVINISTTKYHGSSVVEKNKIVAKEIIFNDKIGRIRDFKIDYTGNIYLISDSPKSYLWKLSKIL